MNNKNNKDNTINIIVPKKILALSSSKKAENMESYKEYIDNALKNDDINVIGVTGDYGSGKSSIIDTYFESFPKKNEMIKVSLGIPCESDDFEKNVIEQIIYSRNPNLSYNSNIRRLDYTFLDLIIKNYFISCPIIIFIIFLYEIFYNKTNYITYYINILLGNAEIASFTIFTIIFIFVLFEILYNIISLFYNFNVKLKIKDIEVTKEEKEQQITYFNKYKTEVIRFFTTHPFIKYVIFEDIDRCKDDAAKDIISNLIEINNIVNKRKNKFLKTKFIIEVKDDLFDNSEKRTKPYGGIIPIIPYSSSISNRDMFIKKFEEICNLKYDNREIVNNNICNVSPSRRAIDYACTITNNPREIKDIINEYLILLNNHTRNYKLTKKTYLNRFDEIFLLSALKVIYPKKYNNLLNNKGPLYELINGIKSIEEVKESSNDLSEYEEKIYRSGLINLEYRRIIVATYKSILSYDDQATLDILQSNAKNKVEFNKEIENKIEVLNNLSIEEFMYDSICNIDLFIYIIDNNYEYYLDYFMKSLSETKIKFLTKLCMERPYVLSNIIDKHQNINNLLDAIEKYHLNSSEEFMNMDGIEYIISSIMISVDNSEIDDIDFFDKIIAFYKPNSAIAKIINKYEIKENNNLKTYYIEINKFNITSETSNLFDYLVANKMYCDMEKPELDYIFIILDISNIPYDNSKVLTALSNVKHINVELYKYYVNNIKLFEIENQMDDEKIILNLIMDINEDIMENQLKIVNIENINIRDISKYNESTYEFIIKENKLIGKFANIKSLLQSNIENKEENIVTYINNRGEEIFHEIGLKNKHKELTTILNYNNLDDKIYKLICTKMKQQNITIKKINNELSTKNKIILIENDVIKFDQDFIDKKTFKCILDNEEIPTAIRRKFIRLNYESFIASFDRTEILSNYKSFLFSSILSEKNIIYLSHQDFDYNDKKDANNLLCCLYINKYIGGIKIKFIKEILQNSDNEQQKISVYLKYKNIFSDIKESILLLNISDFNKIINKEAKSIKYTPQRLKMINLMKEEKIISDENHSSKKPRIIRIKY